MRRTLAALLVAVGVGVVGWVVVDDTGDDVGEVDIAAAPADDPTADVDVAHEPALVDDEDAAAPESSGDEATADEPDDRPAPPPIGRSSARVADLDLTAPTPPAVIDLPSIGVDAPVVPVGIDPDGLMTVPEDVDEVGWYRFGSGPDDDAGTVVLAGHVDSRSQGRGAFFDLRAMEVGDEVTVSDEDGQTTTWRVTGRRSFAKESLPVADLYRRNGPQRLVLITCGGDFDADVGSYRSNVVVQAEPVV